MSCHISPLPLYDLCAILCSVRPRKNMFMFILDLLLWTLGLRFSSHYPLHQGRNIFSSVCFSVSILLYTTWMNHPVFVFFPLRVLIGGSFGSLDYGLNRSKVKARVNKVTFLTLNEISINPSLATLNCCKVLSQNKSDSERSKVKVTKIYFC